MTENVNLFVFTGGPGAGKTALIKALEKSGIQTVDEVAREIIKEQIESGGDALPWKNTIGYTRRMLERSIQSYQIHAGSVDLRFFDRGIPDTLAYARLIGLDETAEIETSVRLYRYNSVVFMLPPWEYIYHTDGERKQSFSEAVKTYHVMRDVYTLAGYKLAEVPVATVAERVEFVIDTLSKIGI